MDESHFDAQYFNPSACISPRERTETILSLVKTLTKLLDERDLDYWLDSGTLLGQSRQQSVILWDNDADIGITMQTYTFLRDNAMKPSIASASSYELQVYESDVNPGLDRDWNIPARFVDTKFGLYVDLFVFTESTANGIALLGTTPSSSWVECVKCIQTSTFAKWFIVPKDYVFPLIPCPLGDFEALCPAKRTLYLAHLYGADFRSEKPS
uniref:LicD/FKTN/FKRP nucleotidyltransferase domain-containing protein n=1 Tax=Globisporangium ultimum (strain ATCC 200006 / CBS 805.95 / DAOM BR144) TaxID=431595 RepID=K3WSA9_GLOUD